jgi:hypothetical protein
MFNTDILKKLEKKTVTANLILSKLKENKSLSLFLSLSISRKTKQQQVKQNEINCIV